MTKHTARTRHNRKPQSANSKRTDELSCQIVKHTSDCLECKLCVKECKLLQQYGTPKKIASSYSKNWYSVSKISFECSLCRLCEKVCPSKVSLDPARLFLEMRREAFCNGMGKFKNHAKLLNYERRGTSKRYSYYGIPEKCDTVLFPGCTLAGTRSTRVMELFEHLKKSNPSLGIVFDCCTKPSHDLGRTENFMRMFGELRDFLIDQGVKNVLVACPSCFQVFKEYGQTLKALTVYEFMSEHGLPLNTQNKVDKITIHDPCATRFEKNIHNAVRKLSDSLSLRIVEMKHHGEKTLCCGEGGAVGFINREISKNWSVQRKDEAQGIRTLTYCAGCVNYLRPHVKVSHILDFLFGSESAVNDREKITKAPFTYLSRIILKNRFSTVMPEYRVWERTEAGIRKKKTGAPWILKSLVALTVLGFITVAHAFDLTQYLELENLQRFIQSFGVMAPLAYILIYSLATSLFLPGLPLTLAAGILFGPVAGVSYSIIGSTTGACVAFFISRSVGRKWMENKMQKNPRFKELDRMVERHGWKAVAFTRLIPVFPFNILNYTFGLTNVNFTHYAVSSFVFMLPATIAFILFSSSLGNLIKGEVTPSLIIGISAIVIVSTIPLAYKKIINREKGSCSMKAMLGVKK